MPGHSSSSDAPAGTEVSPAVLLLVVHRYPDGGGISSILENYVAELDGQYEVHVAIVEEGPAEQYDLSIDPRRVNTFGYSNGINPALMPTSLAYTVRVAAFLRRIVKRIAPRIVITQDALYLPVPTLLACRRTSARVVVMDHGTLTNAHEATWLPMVAERLGRVRGLLFKAGFHADWPWREARWRLGVRYADEVWFTGDELRPWFERAGRRAREYSQSVPQDYRPATEEQRATARRELGLRPDTTVFSSIGRLDGEKGLDQVIDVAARHADSPVDWQLLIAGDGSLSTWLAEEVRRRGMEGRISFTGRIQRPELLRLQHASDFHVYAGTFSCGVSICLLEAMASGVVPISSDVPRAQVELIGDSGWVFPAGDVDAFDAAFSAALALPESDRLALRARVLERIGEHRLPSVKALLDDPLRYRDSLPKL